VVINIVLESCQNHIKDKNMSFKLDTLLIRVVRVSYECRCRYVSDTGHAHWWDVSGLHVFLKWKVLPRVGDRYFFF